MIRERFTAFRTDAITAGLFVAALHTFVVLRIDVKEPEEPLCRYAEFLRLFSKSSAHLVSPSGAFGVAGARIERNHSFSIMALLRIACRISEPGYSWRLAPRS